MTEIKISRKPICPYCNTEMYEVYFKGCLAEFTHWDCACDELEDIQVWAVDGPIEEIK